MPCFFKDQNCPNPDICSGEGRIMEKKENWGFFGKTGNGISTWTGYRTEEDARRVAESVARDFPGVQLTFFQVKAYVQCHELKWTPPA